MFGRMRNIEAQLELIKTILTIRDPGSPKAAEAYEGLRKSIAAAAGDRTAHLVHLAQIDAALHNGEDPQSLELLLRDLMGQAGLERLSDPIAREHYEVDGEGEALTVIEPAYVDATTGRIVRQGRARAQPAEASEVMKAPKEPEVEQ